MEGLYQDTLRLLTETQRQLQELSSYSISDVEVLESRVADSLQQLREYCYKLEIMARKEPLARKQEAKYRVEQMQVDCTRLDNGFRSYQQRKLNAEQAAREREQLLSRKFSTNDSASGDASITIDHHLQHNQRMHESNSHLGQLLAHGSGVLSSLKNQQFTLKGAQRKLLDIGSTLGISNTVMRLIETRTRQDWWIFIAGIVVSSIVIILVLYYLL